MSECKWFCHNEKDSESEKCNNYKIPDADYYYYISNLITFKIPVYITGIFPGICIDERRNNAKNSAFYMCFHNLVPFDLAV